MNHEKLTQIEDDWKIVKSKKGKHPEDYPLGEFLCLTEEHVKIKVQELKEIGVTDIEISNYVNRKISTRRGNQKSHKRRNAKIW